MPTDDGVKISVKSPVPKISKIIGGEIKINPDEISLKIKSVLLKIKGIVVPKKRLIDIPIKKENIDSFIKGPEPAKNILKTSLPSGSVPNRCAFEGVVGCGKTCKSNPTIGS